MRFAIFSSSVLLGNLLMAIMLGALAQPSYADNAITVDASMENKVISFTISNGDDSSAIYTFVATIYGHKHYSRIAETPFGWTAGTIRYQAVMWMTKNYPIEAGATEDGFAIEVRQQGKYTVRWSVMDKTMQPIAWGTINIDG
ncbi:MAG TPA: hypothetical protein VI698_00885 [Nitrososphaerales archaeon]|nr:hypothetical protein [Nitrososphaerales archaeon]